MLVVVRAKREALMRKGEMLTIYLEINFNFVLKSACRLKELLKLKADHYFMKIRAKDRIYRLSGGSLAGKKLFEECRRTLKEDNFIFKLILS